MSSAATGSERALIFDTLLSSPGMSEKCRMSLNPSCQTILLVARLIEDGLANKGAEGGDHLLSYLPPEAQAEVRSLGEELLLKGGLVDFYERLKRL